MYAVELALGMHSQDRPKVAAPAECQPTVLGLKGYVHEPEC